MSGLHEVACGACGKHHVMSAARARSQRVLRCDCGQFVRLDRSLSAPPVAESASEPPSPPDLADAFDDEVTHMVSSLDEVRALGTASRASEVRASLYDRDEDDAATRVARSASEHSRPSTPPPRTTPPPRRPSSPVQRTVTPAPDKPLWYVDLGGAETVQMTIEQVILARRSGKLGEGALVWRAGMPDWRPVGTLIPASSSPSNTPPPIPRPPKDAEANPLGSYDRPVPTLEFAFEKPTAAGSPEAQTETPAPVRVRSSAPPPPRAPTPVPRTPAAPRPHSQVGPLPAPTRPPAPRTPTPLPPPPATVTAAADPIAVTPAASTPPRAVVNPMPLLGRASPAPPAEPASPASFHYPWHGERSRWSSVAIAIAVCIAASGSGAFVVRALKLRRQPLSLATAQVSTATFAATPVPPPAATAPPPTPEATTTVVDVSSLSVEPRAPRPRAALIPPALPISAPALQKPAENSGSGDGTAEASPAPKRAKTSDLPSAAHSNPYTTGAVDNAPANKAAGSDEPGF